MIRLQGHVSLAGHWVQADEHTTPLNPIHRAIRRRSGLLALTAVLAPLQPPVATLWVEVAIALPSAPIFTVYSLFDIPANAADTD